MAVTLNALTTGVGGLQTTGDTSGQISLQSNGSTVVAVTASGVTVTGTLSSTSAVPIASGGTGATTATAAFDALNPMTTTGDIIYESTPSVATRLPIGTTGQVLTVAGGLPSWAAAAAGGFSQMTVFASPGTFTTPASTTRIKVTVVGGGGGAAANGGGAGGGGTAIYVGPVTASTGYAVTVGAAGPAGNPSGATPGVSGGTSSFGALASATGGSGSPSPGASFGSGGAGSAGTLQFSGGNGAINNVSGYGGNTFFGGMAFDSVGKQYGGGGSGRTGGGSNAGAAGVVVVEF
jgi:hypothetical protein